MLRCKGTRDLLPQDMARFRRMEEVFRASCLRWGYEEVRTPTLEYLYLFTSTGTLTPSMLGKVYSFLDWNGWSGERVVLRPEGTIPAARLYVDNLSHRDLVRLFYVENTFTFEETGAQSRERWQCGAELIGGASPLADGELILLALEVLEELGIGEVELRLSHAGLIRAVLKELGLGPVEQTRVMDQILDGNISAMAGIESQNPELRNSLPLLFEHKGSSPGFVMNLKVSLAGAAPGLGLPLDDLAGLAELLSGVGRSYIIDIASGRGFEYYTGAIFQFWVEGRKVGGGGRYDDLIPLVGGREIPACGFALYMDPIMELIPLPSPLADSGRVLVRGEGKGVSGFKECFEAAQVLRQAGYETEFDQGPQATSIRWVLTVGPGPRFRLTDQPSGKSLETATLDGVLEALEAARWS